MADEEWEEGGDAAAEAFEQVRVAVEQQRGEAVKAFYAQLTPEQQKVFDERGMRHGKGEGRHGGHRGGHHGQGRAG